MTQQMLNCVVCGGCFESRSCVHKCCSCECAAIWDRCRNKVELNQKTLNTIRELEDQRLKKLQRARIEIEKNLARDSLTVYNPKLKYKGMYIYFWMDGESVFYVGKGCGDRVVHNHGVLLCQTLRKRAGDRFKAVVVRDGLTDEGAMLLESVLISLLRPIANKRDFSSRKECSPLTIAAARKQMIG